MTYTTVWSDKEIDIDNPTFDHVTVHDIAKCLSRIYRYNGATKIPFSVARHSWIGAVAAADYYGTAIARRFLLHDAHEMVTGDIISPIKRALGPELGQIQRRLDAALSLRFDVDLLSPDEKVDHLDAQMMYLEWKNLKWSKPEAHGLEWVKPYVVVGRYEQLIEWRARDDVRSFTSVAKRLGLS